MAAHPRCIRCNLQAHFAPTDAHLLSASSLQVRTAHKVQASLVVVLTRGGATARLVAKYRPTGGCANYVDQQVSPQHVLVAIGLLCALCSTPCFVF